MIVKMKNSAPPFLTGIVLAAGFSRRNAAGNKLLLAGEGGRPLVCIAAEALCGAGLGEVLVVTGHQGEDVEAALSGLPVRCVRAEHYAAGMGASLAAGVSAADPRCSGFLVTPADLPGLRPEHARAVAGRFLELGCRSHVVPTADGERGHPVALGAWLRPALESLDADIGARALLAEPAEAARRELLELGDKGIVRDRDLA